VDVVLQWIRARAASFAAPPLLSFSVLLLPHVGGSHHDPDVQTEIAVHDASSHRIGRPQADGDGPLHCLACHLSRSARLRADIRFLSLPIAESTAVVIPPVFLVPRGAPVAQPPLRSPPPAPALG
jgi:hypothetical protein